MADDTLKNALLNPKVIQKRREADAGTDEPDTKKGKDMGDLPGDFQLSQAQFSKYPGSKKKSSPPAEMLKNRDRK